MKECIKVMLVHFEAVHSGARPYECKVCGKTFARKESFTRHTHEAIKPFLCTHCGKTFARRHIRDLHERAHLGDKSHECKFCHKKFMTNQKKVVHERIHTGEKPYECQECGKRFVQSHQLQTHSRIHSGARPYQCLTCLQYFRHLATRAKHNCPGKTEEEDDVTNVTETMTVAEMPTTTYVIKTGDNGVGEVYEEQTIILST